MLAAGLVAKKAAERGLRAKPWVKTSLAPGSKVVTEYYDDTGLTPYLEQVGFYTVGYGCTTCIGNSGPAPEPVVAAIEEGDLVAASVLSGNRNFEGRINPHVKANYLASPPLVVAYALAGTVDIDPVNDPLGRRRRRRPSTSRPVADVAELADVLSQAMKPETFRRLYEGIERRTPPGTRSPSRGASSSSGTTRRPTSRSRRSSSTWRPARADRADPRRARARQGRRLRHHRPHQPGRLHRQGLAGRRTSSSAASSRATSTATARAAATTAS
jgi:aconitase A